MGIFWPSLAAFDHRTYSGGLLTGLLTGGERAMHAKLTQEFVDSAKAPAGRERMIYWDASIESFGLMVMAAGHRSYVVQYRADGGTRRYTIKANSR